MTTFPNHVTLNQVVQCHMASSLDNVILAIADPTRRAIIAQLALGPASISDVAAPFSMSLTGVCKHVRVLERAGLVRRTRNGREKILEISPEPLAEVARWVLDYKQFWRGRLDRLEAHFVEKDAHFIEKEDESR